MTAKRPYGQGRTERSPEARMTPEALEALKAILDKDGVSYADWLEAKIKGDRKMYINRNYTDHKNGLHIDKGTVVTVVDFVAKGDGKEWVEVILPDGKHEDVLASAVSA